MWQYILHFYPSAGLDFWMSLVLGTLGLTVAYGVWKSLQLLIKPLFSHLRGLPGPQSPSLVFGHLRQALKADPGELHAQWAEAFGPIMVYKMLFNRDWILALDTKALSHVLNNSYVWEKPNFIRMAFSMLLGDGLLSAEGDSHKRQRRIMNPSFSLSHLRELNGIFLGKSAQLRDIWISQSAERGGFYETDILSWLGRSTLDIIGLAGFDYDFDALKHGGEENELSRAFITVFQQSQRLTIFDILQSRFPILRLIPAKRVQSIAKAKEVMQRIGRQLVRDKKRAILAEIGDKAEAGVNQFQKSSVTTRDLLSRLIIANMATNLPESQKLSDEEVFSQIPTFLVAGQETTATALTWCLYALCLDANVQSKLRDELLGLDSSMPTMEELNSLPYLDAVVRETLRLHPVAIETTRVATKEDVIPLGTPFKDKRGMLRDEIRVKKGEAIVIPILVMNTYKHIWGEDADQFRPERWKNLSEKASDMPGVWGNSLSFLGGPRSCIGYRFALLEMKCHLWTLVREFSFELAVPASEIQKKSNMTMRPFVKSELEKGSQLPVRLTPWRRA